MNDIATIERALKDADLWLDNLVNDKSTCDPQEIRDQITAALTLLRQIPGQHSPTTAARQGLQALQNALYPESAVEAAAIALCQLAGEDWSAETARAGYLTDARTALTAASLSVTRERETVTRDRVWCVECDREGDWEWTYCAWCGSQTFTTADPRPQP